MSTSEFGALPAAQGVRFRLLAPCTGEARLILHSGRAAGEHVMPEPQDGVRDLFVPGAAAGDRYSYRLGSGQLRPDPATRFQPDGVHGPSEIIDPSGFTWTDAAWRGPSLRDLVVYELHVGTFSEHGTFEGVRDHLEELRDLGVTAIELMPLADFPGSRGWGYDAVALYAPARAYGRPQDLRALVDRAHALRLSVILDVVYNHLGPEGAYLPEFNPGHLTDRHTTPWGRAVDLDSPSSGLVRRFLIDSALHWIREYHVDGFRIDATHALVDSSPRHFVRDLSDAVRAAAGRPIVIHAEDARNLANVPSAGGDEAWNTDGVWADDFHHVVRSLVAGDSHGYYVDYEGTTTELARTIRQGWLFAGEASTHFGGPRGTDPSGLPMNRFVVCLQNHDQVGNRAFGDRLHHSVHPAVWRAISVVLLTAPMTPLLFMGQEWAASTPFLFFTDLEPALSPSVTQGRRQEFAAFPDFSDPVERERIPDPQAPATFEASRLRRAERRRPGHAEVLELYRDLLRLRRQTPALNNSFALSGEAHASNPASIIMRRGSDAEAYWIVACLRGSSTVSLASTLPREHAGDWQTVLTTEDPRYAQDPQPARIELSGGWPAVSFARPGAAILKTVSR